MVMGKLTVKQQKFADLWIESGNGTQSYIDAGYKAASRSVAEANARKLLANDSVKKYIAEKMEKLKSEKVADQQEILEFLTSVVRGEKTEQTLIGLGEGEQGITDIDVAANQRIKAAELLGKRYAMWTDKQEVSGDLSVTFVDDIGSDPDGG